MVQKWTMLDMNISIKELLNNNLKDCPQKSGCYDKPFSRVIQN